MRVCQQTQHESIKVIRLALPDERVVLLHHDVGPGRGLDARPGFGHVEIVAGAEVVGVVAAHFALLEPDVGIHAGAFAVPEIVPLIDQQLASFGGRHMRGFADLLNHFGLGHADRDFGEVRRSLPYTHATGEQRECGGEK